MKKGLLVLVVAFIAVFAFAACQQETAPPPAPDTGTGDTANNNQTVTPPVDTGGDVVDVSDIVAPVTNLTGDLRVWSFTNEALVIATAFQEQHPDLNIHFAMASMDDGSYQEMVAQAIAVGTGDVPDIIFMEADFVRTFVQEYGWLQDLSALVPNARALETIPFTVQAGTDDNGVVRAFSYQATPGAMFFRRSMAQRYFGTDDPAQLQAHFANLDLFIESARSIQEQSDGNTRVVGSPTEIYRTFLPNRSQPWVVNNALHIDPLMYDYMTFAYTLRNENLDAEAGQWGDHWFHAMSDDLVDAAGNPIAVFSFFMPTWGLPFVIMQNAGDTGGDWGVIPGPMPFQWGGTWLGMTTVAQNTEAAMEFIRFATLDEAHLTNWATGVYTNEFLAAIDPNVPGDLHQPAGDLVSSARLIRELTPWFTGSAASDFLGGQNPYEIFGEAALAVSFELQQGTDNTIGDAFIDAVDLYITGQADRDETIASFRSDVQMALPMLNW
ncbi:MAG: ABC transporter substrate-binding protein [Defluviitaleaceae bacterium]|nr:ABC transporter substrate-binding protein [Defluviitaleaceae bacterium]